MKDLAKKLILIRIEKKLSPKEMAGKLGVPLSTYRAWETGSGMRAEALRRVAKEFGVSADSLLGLKQDEDLGLNSLLDRIESDVNKVRKKLSKLV